MIPEFPEFITLDIAHRDAVNELISRFEPYSDFNFVSLYAWNIDESVELSTLKGNLIIKMPHYITGETIYSILGDNITAEAIEQLFALSDKLELVPEAVIKKIPEPQEYDIAEDHSNHDYIYDLSQLSKLSGGIYKKQRNKVNYIRSVYGSRITIETTKGMRDQDEIEKLFWQWANINNKDGAEAENEFKALRRLYALVDLPKIMLTTIKVDGVLHAFSINEILSNEFAICHFEKSLLPHKYLPTFVAHVVAKELHDLGCAKVNWEQDLGLAGLRHSKKAFHPERMLKKYSVRARRREV